MQSHKSRAIACAISIICLIAFVGPAKGEESLYEIPAPVIIEPPDSGNAHLLIKPEISFPDTAMIINQAVLDLWVSPQTEDTTYVSIRIYPLTTDWYSESVSWISPWVNPGGDYNDSTYAEYALILPGNQEAKIDLTDLCILWVNGRMPYYGFVMNISETSEAGLTFLNGRNGNGPFAKVNILYSRPSSE
jgi:hypothetical protein